MSTDKVEKLPDIPIKGQRRGSRRTSFKDQEKSGDEGGRGQSRRNSRRRSSILPRIPSPTKSSFFGSKPRRVSAAVVPSGSEAGQLVHVPFEYTQMTEGEVSLPPHAVTVQRRHALPDINDARGVSHLVKNAENIKKTLTFKAIALKVKVNLKWTQDLKDKMEEKDEESEIQKPKETAPTFDLNHYRANFVSYGGMSKRVRAVLNKHPIDRSNDELGLLQGMVVRLKCFSRYSRKAKHELARIIYYETFEDGRVVIQQGHIGMSFYFIVSGKVVAKITEADKVTGNKVTHILGELGEGASFGELALLHNIKRTATIICSGKCEFLRVDKPDFEMVLKRVYEQEWNERLESLIWLGYFKEFTGNELQQFTNLSKFVEFSAGQVILGNIQKRDLTDSVYFITSGECQVVRVVNLLMKSNRLGQNITHAPKEGEEHLFEKRELKHRRFTQASRQDRRLWCICILVRGHYFGVGEDLRNTYIVSKTRVECLLVPRIQITKRGRTQMLDEMRDAMDAFYPSEMEAVRQYNADLRWSDFKDDLIQEILNKPTHRRHIQTASLKDVPLWVRAESGDRSGLVH